jgi:hypothetical protein
MTSTAPYLRSGGALRGTLGRARLRAAARPRP